MLCFIYFIVVFYYIFILVFVLSYFYLLFLISYLYLYLYYFTLFVFVFYYALCLLGLRPKPNCGPTSTQLGPQTRPQTGHKIRPCGKHQLPSPSMRAQHQQRPSVHGLAPSSSLFPRGLSPAKHSWLSFWRPACHVKAPT